MAEVIKKATRDGYGNALVELAEKYDNLIVMDADLAAATKTGVFKKAYPCEDRCNARRHFRG